MKSLRLLSYLIRQAIAVSNISTKLRTEGVFAIGVSDPAKLLSVRGMDAANHGYSGLISFSKQLGQPTGISFVDSTAIAACRNQRIQRYGVFRGLASEGRLPWADFAVSNGTWSLMIGAKSWLLLSRPAMWLTANRYQHWPNLSSTSFLAIMAIFPQNFSGCRWSWACNC